MTRPFYVEGTRLLTPEAFEFVLRNELQRAVRSQSFLTLVVVEVNREWNGASTAADEGTMRDVAQIFETEVRDTDLISVADGTLYLVLLDSDFAGSAQVVERIFARIENFEFATALRLAAGAACYPIDAIDAESLKQHARQRPLVQWRGGGVRGDRIIG